MSNLTHRENTILPADSGDGEPVYGASYQVIAYSAGAQVTSVSGTTITVRAGHGFSANQRLMVGIDESSFVVASSVTATSITTSADISSLISVHDYLVNLESDGGSSAPDYTGSNRSIYTDMAGGNAISNATVTCNSEGLYEYWHNTAELWELVLDSSGSPVKLIPFATGHDVQTASTSSTDNQIARFHSTTGHIIQTSSPTIDDSGVITAAGLTNTGNSAITGTLTVTGATALNGGLTMDTNKFTVADTSGNTAIAGTLAVTGASTLTGNVTLAGILDLGSVTAFADADATPSVSGGVLFKTANTGGTTITAFDDGVEGQVIAVLINDALTTIDFTGTTLKGNAGVDWSPGSGDFLIAWNDGTNWNCLVGDTTA